MIDLVSISFVKFLDLKSCKQEKYQHVISILEEVNVMHLKIYEFFHLHMFITDCFNHTFEFIWLFLAVDQDSCDSQILLERSALKNFWINIYNDNDSWKFEFEHNLKVIILLSEQFAKELLS